MEPMTEIKKVGVIGAGQMGAGIAQVCAVAGLDVVLNDVTEERIDHGLATISGNLARLLERQQPVPAKLMFDGRG